MKAIMISGRTLSQGASCESKMSHDFRGSVSIASLSDDDYRALGLSESENVRISGPGGSAVLSAKSDPGLPRGVVFIPMGPWANALVGSDTGGCGTPHYKGVEVDVEGTSAPVATVGELFAGLARAKA